MKVTELKRDQLIQLKQRYLTDWYDTYAKSPSMGELANADSIISDELVFDYFEGDEFVEDDFIK